jgi:hypothetical protein
MKGTSPSFSMGIEATPELPPIMRERHSLNPKISGSVEFESPGGVLSK